MIAISGTTSISGTTRLRWDGIITAQTLLTQGGNITAANLVTTQLTSRWASYFGNVSGTIRLSDTTAGAAVYTWTYNTAAGGEVCASTGAGRLFASPVNGTTTAIDTQFVTSGTPDNASATFTTICPTLTLNTGVMTNFIAASTGTFKTCAGTFDSAATTDFYGFCTSINASGANYLGTANNYEIIVPTGTANRTYSFYMELN